VAAAFIARVRAGCAAAARVSSLLWTADGVNVPTAGGLCGRGAARPRVRGGLLASGHRADGAAGVVRLSGSGAISQNVYLFAGPRG
jgi:hypothetical protein